MNMIDETLKKFNDNRIPISVFLLGDKWHNNIENYMYDKSLFNLQTINNYYRMKEQRFGLTINPTLPIQANDPLYNIVSQYIGAQKNGVSLVPLDNNTISVYLNTISCKHFLIISKRFFFTSHNCSSK